MEKGFTDLEVTMDGPRAPEVSEYPSLIQFLNQNLRPQFSWSIQDEYPTALSPANLHNMRVITAPDDKSPQVLSHALIRPVLIRTNIGIFKVAGIGSVVTSSEHRNQGLSAKILEECLSSARRQECDFAILWTNLFDFYRKIGFELAGTELSFRLDGELPPPLPSLRYLESSKVDPSAIYRLFSSHSVASIRTVEEIRKYLEIPNSRVHTAWSSGGQLEAYVIEGKGADLQGYIHEWGGGVTTVLSLLSHVKSQNKKEHTFLVPSHCENMIRQLRDGGHSSHSGYLGMIKILQPANLFGKIIRQARSEYGISDLRMEYKDSIYYLGRQDSLFKTTSDADMVRLVFGPPKPEQLHSFDPKTLEILQKLLPIKMWIWGWDSV